MAFAGIGVAVTVAVAEAVDVAEAVGVGEGVRDPVDVGLGVPDAVALEVADGDDPPFTKTLAFAAPLRALATETSPASTVSGGRKASMGSLSWRIQDSGSAGGLCIAPRAPGAGLRQNGGLRLWTSRVSKAGPVMLRSAAPSSPGKGRWGGGSADVEGLGDGGTVVGWADGVLLGVGRTE
jgi:hypothetical protein